MLALVGSLLAYGIVSRVKPQYEVHFSYAVSLEQREQSQEYRFDGFYALQATDLFTATLASWIKAPEIIVKAHEVAGLESPTDPREVSRAVRSDKTAPQLVQVTVRHTSKEFSQELAQALQEVIREEVERYHDQGIPELSFAVVATEPWVGLVGISHFLVVVSTFVLILVIGINWVVLTASLVSPKK